MCVNVLRHPAWGRAQETYGEDPHHVGELGAAFTRGLQRHVMACVKHFACNSMENARFKVDVQVDEVALHEVYLPHFRRIVDEGVAVGHVGVQQVNGEWCGESRELLTDVLRDEWGFEGFVISDWIFGLRDAAPSLDGGPRRRDARTGWSGPSTCADALERGDASWDDVDRAVERVVATLLRFADVLSAPRRRRRSSARPSTGPSPARSPPDRSCCCATSRSTGAPVLPLDAGRTGRGVRSAGRRGQPRRRRVERRVGPRLPHRRSTGSERASADVVHDDGADVEHAAAAVAAAADVALVVVGYTYLDEGEYIGETDPRSTELFPPRDDPDVVERFEAWIATGPPVRRPSGSASRQRGFGIGATARRCGLLHGRRRAHPRRRRRQPAHGRRHPGGSAVVIAEWVDAVPAVVQSWYGGSQAGPGLADVLLGAVDPSGRLPFTVPVDEADLPPFDPDADDVHLRPLARLVAPRTQRHRARLPVRVRPSLHDLRARPTSRSASPTGRSSPRGAVRNTGDRDGPTSCRSTHRGPDHDTPARLVGFTRVDVPPAA